MEKRYEGLRVRKQDGKEIAEYVIRLPEFKRQSRHNPTFREKLKKFFLGEEKTQKLTFTITRPENAVFSKENITYSYIGKADGVAFEDFRQNWQEIISGKRDEWLLFDVSFDVKRMALFIWNAYANEIVRAEIRNLADITLCFKISEDEHGIERVYEVEMGENSVHISLAKSGEEEFRQRMQLLQDYEFYSRLHGTL
ncbi:MAG: hypothetical protein Q4B34_01320 [Candidatus Saccharibacteria bacterium]|nr:hypothetical protein [Candidatus Saccharibacteria bacterium]